LNEQERALLRFAAPFRSDVNINRRGLRISLHLNLTPRRKRRPSLLVLPHKRLVGILTAAEVVPSVDECRRVRTVVLLDTDAKVGGTPTVRVRPPLGDRVQPVGYRTLNTHDGDIKLRTPPVVHREVLEIVEVRDHRDVPHQIDAEHRDDSGCGRKRERRPYVLVGVPLDHPVDVLLPLTPSSGLALEPWHYSSRTALRPSWGGLR